MISTSCHPFVLPLLCHTQFPYCDPKANPLSPVQKQLCRSDCLKLQDDICAQEYEKAKADIFFSKELLPDCSKLPLRNCVKIFRTGKNGVGGNKDKIYPIATCEFIFIPLLFAFYLIMHRCIDRKYTGEMNFLYFIINLGKARTL